MICSEEFLSVIENENLESLRNQTRLRQTGNLHIFASQSIIYFGLNSHTIKLTVNPVAYKNLYNKIFFTLSIKYYVQLKYSKYVKKRSFIA